MRRRLFRVTVITSLAALIATISIWCASYRSNGIDHRWPIESFVLEGTVRFVRMLEISAEHGRISVGLLTHREPVKPVSDEGEQLKLDLETTRVTLPLWTFAIAFAIVPVFALARAGRAAGGYDSPTVTDVSPSIGEWEAAYRRFETPEQEVAKFTKRLRQMGANDWPRDAQVVEIFCGRGNGLVALANLGFTNLEGVDLSADLLSRYKGHAKTYVADCRHLPFESATRDIIIVQGGLHHLPTLPDDLEQTLKEVRRVLRPGGRFMVVEPWLTPFLRSVHFVVARRFAAAMSSRVDALHTMIEHERETYENWLSRKSEILALFERHFVIQQRRIRLGKLMLMGTPR